MDKQKDAVEILKEKNNELEKENQILKEMLAEAGIDYKDRLNNSVHTDEIFDLNQGARIKAFSITEDTANHFFRRFWGRQDVYALRGVNKEGRTVYYPKCNNFWKDGCYKKLSNPALKKQCKDCEYRSYKTLTRDVVISHLKGEDKNGKDVLAVYPMLDGNMCRFLVFDFDNHEEGAELQDYANNDNNWMEEAGALRDICRILNIDVLIERSRSGRGAHVWIFFDKPIPAGKARKFGFKLLDKGAEAVNLKNFRYYDRMIPNQDVLANNEIGNVIALPLQGMSLKNGNSAFVDENWNAYHDQLKTLWNVKKYTEASIDECISQWEQEDLINDFAKASDNAEKPWDRKKSFSISDAKGNVSVVLSDMIYVDTENLRPGIQNRIRRMAAFRNPVYYRNQAIGISNFNEYRYIYMGYDDEGYICLPRGLKEELFDRFDAAGISYSVNDKRCIGRNINVSFSGELKDSQKTAAESILRSDTGILSAATAFGKTVVCCNMIAKRKVNTLILIESSSLIEQWQKAIDRFLKIDEEPPKYTTKSGRVRTRKNAVGLLQGSHDSLTGIIDIAMAGSVCKKGEFHPLLEKYGQIILDECHHAASDTFIRILEKVKAKYVYGVTATPVRTDGKEKINYMFLGPVRYRFTAKDRAKEQGIEHLVYPRFTRTVSPHHMNEKMHPNEAYELIRNNEIRDEQIINDVKNCVENGRTPVVLTKYIDHAKRISDKLRLTEENVILMTGGGSKKDRKNIIEQMNKIGPDDHLILVATGQLIGEGFDFPRLDTLIMASPVAASNIVEQYAGRLNRDYEGKEKVIIYDYVDSHIPMFDNMYSKRLKAYKRIGYDICTDVSGSKQTANAIFDIDTYDKIFWKDLLQAKSDIIISSPGLNSYKVERLMSVMKEKLEHGIKATIVTWHPDYYKYGKSESRMELLERLRLYGFNIELVEKTCERFAVIDHEIVWYGSVNLLSKEDIDDNLMRVENKKIAAELLELTFRNKDEMEKW